MTRKIFVNLPVKSLPRSKAFFEALGFSFNPQFTNEQGACLVVEKDSIYVMLLVEPFFQGFTRKSLCDARTHTEVLLCLSVTSRSEVDAMVAKALSAGGREPMEAKDYGFMYQRGFEDLDGHLWEVVHMDEGATPSE